jgi:amino acid transporter
MYILINIISTVLLGAVFIYISRKKESIAYFRHGKWLLTWFSIAIITLMDELTSIFYAPAEAFRFIGMNAIFFIIITSILIRFLSTRMVEIAEILEMRNVKGGGVYSFSYIVLGPVISFVAVASIMLDYILTASISSVSAVENGLSLFPVMHFLKFPVILCLIWFIAWLNIVGIKENAKFTYTIFAVSMLILLNLLLSGFIHANPSTWMTAFTGVKHSVTQFRTHNIASGYLLMIGSISSCILAYSGVESVIQSAGYVRSWKDISKAYMFLALTVGIMTPLICLLVLSSGINVKGHETDLITSYATGLHGVPFGLIVGLLASITLAMAVNTAFVASSELLEKVAERYNLHWFSKTNSRQSLYRIHIINAALYSIVVIATSGSQKMLAEMYAMGLLACFCINIFCLILYRYSYGTTEIKEYNTSRTGTIILFVLLFSCFVWMGFHKIYGTFMWVGLCALFLALGIRVAKKRAPEIKEIQQTDSPMDILLHIVESKEEELHIHFLRRQEKLADYSPVNDVLIHFYSPRQGIPPKLGDNHFRIQAQSRSLIDSIVALLDMISYEGIENKRLIVHFGWPMSSWWDRIAIGVMVFNIMKLPAMFPKLIFRIEYQPKKQPA